MIREILCDDNPLLRQISTVTSEFNTTQLQSLSQDLIDTMVANKGVGLAAPQIGVLQRVIVVLSHITPIVMINPTIVKMRDQRLFEREMCLSFPGIYVSQERAFLVTVQYQDVSGMTHKVKMSGLEAVCVQHEVDHLNGVVIGDFNNK